MTEKTINQLAQELGLNKETLHQRIKRQTYLNKNFMVEKNDTLTTITITDKDIRRKKINGKDTILLSSQLCDVISYEEHIKQLTLENKMFDEILLSNTAKAKKLQKSITQYLRNAPIPKPRKNFLKKSTNNLVAMVSEQEKQINELCMIIRKFQTALELLGNYPDFELRKNYSQSLLASLMIDEQKKHDQQYIDMLNKWKEGDFSDIDKIFKDINLNFDVKSYPY